MLFRRPGTHIRADLRENDLCGQRSNAIDARQVHSGNAAQFGAQMNTFGGCLYWRAPGSFGVRDWHRRHSVGALRQPALDGLHLLLDPLLTLQNLLLKMRISQSRLLQIKELLLFPMPCQGAGQLGGLSREPPILQAGQTPGSRSPAKMASMMRNPVSPLISLITLANCTFISVSAFCIC